jgi:hypothetical protein
MSAYRENGMDEQQIVDTIMDVIQQRYRMHMSINNRREARELEFLYSELFDNDLADDARRTEHTCITKEHDGFCYDE